MYKMYFLVLYSLSPIQQWIQAGHSAIEYLLKYDNEETKQRAREDKTFIILNWWTSVSLSEHIKFLQKQKINIATFQEPDIWNITTCCCFIWNDNDDIVKYFTNLFKLA